MPNFDDLIAQLSNGVENIGDVEAFTAELRAEHEKVVDIHTTKIGALEGDIGKLNDTVTSLKLTNYDLIATKGVTGGGDSTPVVEAPKEQGINSLFKTKD